MPRHTNEDVSVFARRTRLPVPVVQAWLAAVDDRAWATTNMRILHDAGLSPEQGKDLYGRVPSETRQQMARLVDAGRMASLDTRYLHWWAASGLLRAEVTPGATTARGRPGRRIVNFTKWVTEARRYITATKGDQRLAALAAAAHLSVSETDDRYGKPGADGLDEETLMLMIALREGFQG